MGKFSKQPTPAQKEIPAGRQPGVVQPIPARSFLLATRRAATKSKRPCLKCDRLWDTTAANRICPPCTAVNEFQEAGDLTSGKYEFHMPEDWGRGMSPNFREGAE